jgi:hypothetical protein
MRATILLNSNENTDRIEDEEKTRFVRSILEMLELPIDDLWEENGDLSIESKIKFRSLLATYNIQIIDSIEGELQIYCDGETIGRWNKCEYVLKKDLKQKDPAKKLYLEMKTDCWSIFDNIEQ